MKLVELIKKYLYPDNVHITYQEKLQQLYQSLDYPMIPKIPSESESKRILEEYQSFSACLVAKEYMKKDGNPPMIRGDFIILWWLTLKHVDVANYPRYFLFQYGIDFPSQLKDLKDMGLVTDSNKLSDKGSQVLKENFKFIDMHRADKIYSENGGPVIYKFKKKYTDETILKELKFPKNKTEKNLDDYFYHSQDRLQTLWKLKKYDELEKYGNKLIGEGAWYPSYFQTMAMLYRKQKKYNLEIDILNKGIKAQIDHTNPGVACKNFEIRLKRAKELMIEQKSK